MAEKEKTIELKTSQMDSEISYQKIDHIRASRLGNNFSVSFYQLNYQQIADELDLSKGSNDIIQTNLISIGKFVMNEESFRELGSRVQEILKKYEEGKNK